MSEENKAIMRRWVEEIWNKGNLDVIDEIVGVDFVRHDPSDPEPVLGQHGLKHLVTMYREAFPDLTFAVEDQIAEGDKVVSRWTSTGTHKCDLGGIAPTGNATTGSGIHIARIVNGKVMEGWNNGDSMGLMQQLGVIPTREDLNFKQEPICHLSKAV
jgi:steroid delta-isomerase-like uncharacterized protein